MRPVSHQRRPADEGNRSGNSLHHVIREGSILNLTGKEREALNQRDMEIINTNADYFNSEMEDVLRYQAVVDFDDLDRETFDLVIKVPISEEDLEP